MRKIQANDPREKPSPTDQTRRAQIEKLRKDASDSAHRDRLIAKTLAEVDHLDWSLIEVWERIRKSRDAIASSIELLARVEDQEQRLRAQISAMNRRELK